MRLRRRLVLPIVAASIAAMSLPASGQQSPTRVDVEPSVWDLTIGLHALELPTSDFADFACGTNGGPPSRPIDHWSDYPLCRAETDTGWHEVYFQYDDLYWYIALAADDQFRQALYEYTSVYSRPVISSALFDADGFMRGLRLVTDPRVDTFTRSQAHQLSGFLQARQDGDWQCENFPREEGQDSYQGLYVNRLCNLIDEEADRSYSIRTTHFRRPGQTILNPDNRPTEGYFESVTRYEEFMLGEIENREERLATVAALPPAEEDPLVVTARDCPGCDLSGVNMRRADLRGANLAGANLEGASLHAVDLTGANLAGANLRNANLNRALLTQANLSGATLSGALLYEARLDGANLSDVTALAALAAHSRMIRANLTGAIIAESNLEAVRMTSVTAVDASFARSRLWDAQMSRSDFTNAIFARADLRGAILTEVVLTDADMRISDLYGVDFRDADLTNADLAGSRLELAILGRTILDGANFEGAILPAGFTPPD